MEKICLIKQPAGIGDILFCQKIAKVIQEETEYKKIIWPVSEQYYYLKDYLICNDIEFPIETENFLYKDIYLSNSLYMIKEDNFLYVPLETSSFVEGHCKCHDNSRAHGHMKYNFCNISYSNWKDYFKFNRNFEREDNLIKLLGIDINEPFNLINKNCGTYPNILTTQRICPNNNFKNIYMEFIDGINIFDWIKIFKHAQEIHSMECGVYYILEKLNLDSVHIYSKYTSEWDDGKNRIDDFSYMKDHCNKKWRFIN
jgi:hypothetical protein